MNDNAKKWVEALESGKYKQDIQRLKNIDTEEVSYCCLGVACELYLQEHPGKARWIKSLTDAVFVAEDFLSSSYLPRPVAEWLGIQTVNGAHIHPETKKETSLGYINDEEKTDFKGIAAIIRAEPEGLFGKYQDEYHS